jgi:hypothetical protein
MALGPRKFRVLSCIDLFSGKAVRSLAPHEAWAEAPAPSRSTASDGHSNLIYAVHFNRQERTMSDNRERQATEPGQVPMTTSARAPAVRSEGAVAIGATVIGALALGAFAVGALAIGKLAIGQLSLGRTRIRSGQIDHLRIARLTIEELQVQRVTRAR